MRIISFNELFEIEPIFNECFKCGSKEYKEIYIKDHLFRLCKNCENHPDVVSHFIKLNRGLPKSTQHFHSTVERESN